MDIDGAFVNIGTAGRIIEKLSNGRINVDRSCYNLEFKSKISSVESFEHR